jgi:CheY-like chemotaxis protein
MLVIEVGHRPVTSQKRYLETPESDLGDMIGLLVVDEHPVIAEGIRAILNDQPDFWVDAVTDVDSATAALEARHHDIVICEVRLQGRNAGLDLLRQRRMDGSAFIMFSAHSSPAATPRRLNWALQASCRRRPRRTRSCERSGLWPREVGPSRRPR